MLKTVSILFVFVFSFCNLLSQTSIHTINGHEFEFREMNISEFESEEIPGIDFIVLFREDQKLLSHIKYDRVPDCSGEFIQLGTYTVDEEKVIFYTYWASANRDRIEDQPYGFMKQEYVVQSDGKVVRSGGEVYLQSSYLDATDEYSLESKNQHISYNEEEYGVDFVFGSKRKTLEIEVRKLLQKEIDFHTKEWVKEFGKNCRF